MQAAANARPLSVEASYGDRHEDTKLFLRPVVVRPRREVAAGGSPLGDSQRTGFGKVFTASPPICLPICVPTIVELR